jgi:hypothetical protein
MGAPSLPITALAHSSKRSRPTVYGRKVSEFKRVQRLSRHAAARLWRGRPRRQSPRLLGPFRQVMASKLRVWATGCRADDDRGRSPVFNTDPAGQALLTSDLT